MAFDRYMVICNPLLYGRYEQSCYVNNKAWYKLKLNLCDKCKETYDYKIIKALEELGFRKD